MNFSKVTFESKDVVKLVGFVAVVCGMWFDLKSDLRTFKATTELRIMQLEKENEKKYKDYPTHYALVPEETKINDEN